MASFFKWTGIGLLLLLLLLGIGFLNVWYFKPLSLNAFYARVFLKVAFYDPELLTDLGLVEQFGMRGHQSRLTDISDAHQTEQAALLRSELATLHRYDRSRLNEAEQLSYDTLDNFMSVQVEGERWRYHNYPLNQTNGIQSELPSFMLAQHPLNDLRDAQDYVKRLNAFPTKFAQLLEGLKIREARKLIPPRFIVEEGLSEMQAFVAKPVKENPLYAEFAKKLEKVASIDAASRNGLLAAAETAIQQKVNPAYATLIGYLQTLQPKATANNGVWALPEGEAYYAWCVRQQTTSRLTPDEVHEIGLREVARIETQMDGLLKALGLAEGSIGARMQTLAQEPEQLYPDNDAGRAQMLKDYQSIIDEIDAGLDSAFDVRPKLGVKVERIPVFREATAPGAYYQPGAFDGSRPGVFFANLHVMGEHPRFAMRTLAYHEAIPGHHFQISIAQELKGLPFFRKVLPFTAYVEGWALYAERLASELGFEKDPASNLGRLQAEMFRAVRLVVDTGMHRKRWTREQAIAYMRDKTGIGEKEVTSEIERYLADPAQALAYKLGMLKILELRDYAKQVQGERFDLKQFHNLILTSGALPLPLLEQHVKRAIDQSAH